MIITIDGPAGTGKSTVARRLANRLGFSFLDTGAMYRAVGWLALHQNMDLSDQEKVGKLAEEIQLQFVHERVFVGDLDVTQLIRSQEVTHSASIVAANLSVRGVLVTKQKEFGALGDLVTEGRDQGTVVFPQAECKFFLTASAEVRAKRRCDELILKGDTPNFEEILAAQIERDHRDENRDQSPLKPAQNAYILDTSEMTMDEVLDRLYLEVISKQVGNV